MVKTVLSLYIGSDAVEKVRRVAAKQKTSLAKVVEKLITEKLEE